LTVIKLLYHTARQSHFAGSLYRDYLLLVIVQ